MEKLLLRLLNIPGGAMVGCSIPCTTRDFKFIELHGPYYHIAATVVGIMLLAISCHYCFNPKYRHERD